MAFKPIETQEELDNIIKARLNREKESLDKKIREEVKAEYQSQINELSTFKTQIEDLQKEIAGYKSTIETEKATQETDKQTIADLQAKIEGFETANLKTRIALNHGLPFDFANRLNGTTEDEITADAEKMADFFVQNKPQPPLKTAEPSLTGEDAAYQNILNNLFN